MSGELPDKSYNPYDKSRPINEPEHINPQQQPQLEKSPGMSDWIQMGEYILSNPQIRGLIIKYGSDIDEALDEYLGNYKGIVYSYVKGKYPEVYEALTANRDDAPRNSKEAPGRDFSDEEDDDRPRLPGSSILQQAVNDAFAMLDGGIAPKDVAENINDYYDLNWTFQTVNRMVTRRPYLARTAQDSPGRTNSASLSQSQKEKIKSILDENKRLVQEATKYTKVGLFRRFLKWLI